MKTIDMSVGHPEFLFPYWLRESDELTSEMYPTRYMEMVESEDLKIEITQLHKKIGNINPDDYEIVIGNGATQVLAAALSAMSDYTGKETVYAQAPHFSRFRPISNSMGMLFTTDDYWEQRVEILTIPNNPDCTRKKPKSNDYIVDACYNWPQYRNGKVYDLTGEDIVIFSLSKTTGHAGTRIGWALVKKTDVAHEMRRFIEHATMGVSVEAQHMAQHVLWSARNPRIPKEDVFQFGQKVLDSRWKKLKELKNILPFEILNKRGMFALCKGYNHLENCYVSAVHGPEMGLGRDVFRLNLGCSEDTFQDFIKEVENGSKKR